MQYPLHTAAASATCTSGATYCINQDQTDASGTVIGRSSSCDLCPGGVGAQPPMGCLCAGLTQGGCKTRTPWNQPTTRTRTYCTTTQGDGLIPSGTDCPAASDAQGPIPSSSLAQLTTLSWCCTHSHDLQARLPSRSRLSWSAPWWSCWYSRHEAKVKTAEGASTAQLTMTAVVPSKAKKPGFTVGLGGRRQCGGGEMRSAGLEYGGTRSAT